MTDEIPVEGQPAEEGKELELDETPEEPEAPVETTPGDPLDEIDDIEELRGKAKGYRSASQRKKPTPEEPVEAPKEAPESGFLTKKDFYKANERKAINSITEVEGTDSDELKTQKEFAKENWEQIKTFYSPRSGKDTPEDIVKDLNDAVTLYKSNNPAPVEDKSSEISETTGAGGGSAPPKKGEKTEQPPGFSLPKQPVDKDGKVTWYKDPNKSE